MSKFGKNDKYYGFQEYQEGAHVSDVSIVGVQTDAAMQELHEAYPHGKCDAYSTVEEAVSAVYCGPDSVELRLEGKDKEKAIAHMSALDDNFHTTYREYLDSHERPGMTEQEMDAQAKYYEMDDFYKKILAPGYGDFDPCKDQDAFRSFGKDIKEYTDHLENGDFTKYPFTDNYRYFKNAELSFAEGCNTFGKNYDPYGYADACNSEEDALAQALDTVRDVKQLGDLSTFVSEAYESIYDDAIDSEDPTAPRTVEPWETDTVSEIIDDIPVVKTAGPVGFDFGRDISSTESLGKPRTHEELNKNNRELLDDSEFSEMIREEQDLDDIMRGEHKPNAVVIASAGAGKKITIQGPSGNGTKRSKWTAEQKHAMNDIYGRKNMPFPEPHKEDSEFGS